MPQGMALQTQRRSNDCAACGVMKQTIRSTAWQLKGPAWQIQLAAGEAKSTVTTSRLSAAAVICNGSSTQGGARIPADGRQAVLTDHEVILGSTWA